MASRTPRVVFAVATLVLGVVLAIQSPWPDQLPDGWVSSVLALEFARSWAEVAWISDPEMADALRRVHRTDTLFPLAYGGLMALWVSGEPGWRGRLGVAFAIGAIPADLYENSVLMGLVDAVAAGAPPDPWLAKLPLATSVKWVLIGAASAVLAVGQRPLWMRIPAGLAAIGVAAAVATFSPLVCEAMAAAVVAFYGALFVGSLRREDSDGDDRDEGAVATGA